MVHAPYPDVSLKDSDAERRFEGTSGPGRAEPTPPDGVPPSPSAPRERGAEPLTAEQLAFYKERMENGFYQSDTVRRHIAERLADDVLTRPPR